MLTAEIVGVLLGISALSQIYGSPMYPPPAGKDLTVEQARELDDTFLSSKPFDHFRSRIASLLAWQETATHNGGEPTAATGSRVRREFTEYLGGRPEDDHPFNALEVQAQVAAEAFAARHFAAEAVLRLACARLAPDPAPGPRCLWAAIALGPAQISEVVARLNEAAKSPDASERFFQAVVPPSAIETARSDPKVVTSAIVFGEWVAYAAKLLSPAEIDLQAAHNKVKHGLTVRPRADMRVALVTTPPRQDGSLPVGAFTADRAIDIFDQPVLEFLARGPKVIGHRQGLELTQLRLRPSALLADAFMLAMTHGAMFHVAAAEHFTGRDDVREDLGPPDFPGYPSAGPRPSDIDAQSPIGMRFPMTTPPGGGPTARTPGIGFRDHFQPFHLDYLRRVRGVVVVDE